MTETLQARAARGLTVPDNRYFLGFGERLSTKVSPSTAPSSTEPAYTFDEAVSRLRSPVAQTAAALLQLPSLACPRNEAVGVITMHPQWLSKSSHPQQLLTEYNLRQVGSRPVQIAPEKWTKKDPPEPAASTSLFVAGDRRDFARWSEELRTAPRVVSDQIQRLESVTAPSLEGRLKNFGQPTQEVEPVLLEVVLHASAAERDQYILAGFQAFASTLGAAADMEQRLHAGGLCFLPVEVDERAIPQLAEFSFLRVARPMPRLRGLPGITRSRAVKDLPPAALPTEGAIDPNLRMAVFDTGLPSGSALAPWTRSLDAAGVDEPPSEASEHGHNVTSALLFGSLVPGKAAPRPYGVVDHYRVTDKHTDDDLDLFPILRRILDVLQTRTYDLVNLSIGPAVPVEDDDVHTWTSLLDEYLATGQTLLTVAAGNTGDEGIESEARVQVPADCVNALTVGASDSSRSDWGRAFYSSCGPGRSPGLIKPDVLSFGGDGLREEFFVYDSGTAPSLAELHGTSFAAPAALRMAAGLRAHFGSRITPLALKALLIHSSTPGTDQAQSGWGRIPDDLESVATCGDGMVRVIYQGELDPAKYLRVQLPMPLRPLSGMVGMCATICYATQTDPADPGAYTRSGLEITFRPHMDRYVTDESVHPAPKPFFGARMTAEAAERTEQALRGGAHKWETVQHARKSMRASSLLRPVFDIHYNARTGGGAAQSPSKVRYAMVVTVECTKVPDLYDEVVRSHAGQLEVLAPVVQIPVRVY